MLVQATPEEVYDVVSDITRTGEWSVQCEAAWWEDETEAGQVGAWFVGRNATPSRTWETRSQVAVASRGREFAWLVGGAWVRWGFRMGAGEGGTQLTQTWDFLTAGYERFVELYGDEAPAQIDDRTRAAHEGIPVTLARIRDIVEA
ncbi:SRPBCC family protein [Nocardioides marmoraquaticus]